MLTHHRMSPYARVLNVYTCEPSGGVLGWISAFPDELSEDDNDHGVFLLHSTLPGTEQVTTAATSRTCPQTSRPPSL